MRALLLLLVVGCADDGDRTPVVVFAASSLTESFEALERAYESAHPAIDVQPTFAGSQVLRLQIEHGAPADVFASADAAHMDALADRVEQVQVFAHNELALIVPKDSPLRRFDELERARRIVVGARTVPVGRYTRLLLERAETTHGETFVGVVRAAIASEETNVRLVRAKVQLGEADAAFVYRSDLNDEVRAVPIPDELRVGADYPIAIVGRGEHRAEAMAFVAFVRGAEGRDILERHGFRAEAE